MASILVVDDERSAREFLRLLFEQEGHEVRVASNGVEALLALERESSDLILTDLEMPEMGGLELLAHLERRWSEVPTIVLTAADDVSKVVEAVQLGATNYLVKPANAAAVVSVAARALVNRTNQTSTPSNVSELVGISKPIVEVRHRVILAARSDVPVLVSGATGTGKELVARAIHHYSSVTDGPFVAHNCAVSPRDLFESQFFGHKKGAFTGAERDHAGLLEQAHGGVLFLDELEALALEHQAKLLRVLDDGEVRRVGASDSTHVSVRFVAATNRDAEQMIRAGELREDLYFRLRGFEISLPPLRDRPDDIPLLAKHFLDEGDPGIAADAIAALSKAAWPGNIRELRNAVRSARAEAGEGSIRARHLPAAIRQAAGAPPAMAARGAAPSIRGLTLKEIERRAIIEALDECGGNRSRAARMLDIDRSTLRRKIQEYGIDGKGS